MQTPLTVLIVLGAVAYLAWRYVPGPWRKGPSGGGASCGDCHGCDPVKH